VRELFVAEKMGAVKTGDPAQGGYPNRSAGAA